MKRVWLSFYAFALLILVAAACTSREQGELGSRTNPIRMFFVPSGEVDKVISSGDVITNFMTLETGYYYKTAVPTSYTAVVESLGSGQADVAWLPAFAYVLAHHKYGAEVSLRAVRHGAPHYRGEFITHISNTDINSLEDIHGRRFAFTDAASASGFIIPYAFLAKLGIKPGETVFAGGHPQAALAVYMRSVDATCTFEGARQRVEATFPDIVEKTKIIGHTEWIPNDNVSFRKELPDEMKARIKEALVKFVRTDEGRKILVDLYNIEDLLDADDSDYQMVRESAYALGIGSF